MSLSALALIISVSSLLCTLVVIVRTRRSHREDPRLSQGLQLLQSKIAILEDLSDRTDNQVTQLTSFMEHKVKQLQSKVQEAQEHLVMIDQSIGKSMEVAEIFQDKIPHEEIIERKNRVKYVKAARLSHQGKSVEEIAQAVDLPRGEIEMIAKVNREQLMFSDKKLPEWAKKMAAETARSQRSPGPLIEMNDRKPLPPQRQAFGPDYSRVFEVQKPDLSQVKKMNQELKESSRPIEPTEGLSRVASQIVGAAKTIGDKIVNATEQILKAETGPIGFTTGDRGASTTMVVPNSYVKETLGVHKNEIKQVDSSEIKKVLFPKIDLNDNLG